MITILQTNNEEYGFWGTVANKNLNPAREWNDAFQWVHAAIPKWSAGLIRDFLDSRHGRYLADAVSRGGGIRLLDPARWTMEFIKFYEEITAENFDYDLKSLSNAAVQLMDAEYMLRQALKNLDRFMRKNPQTTVEPVQGFLDMAGKMKETIEKTLKAIKK